MHTLRPICIDEVHESTAKLAARGVEHAASGDQRGKNAEERRHDSDGCQRGRALRVAH
jgi:hypothetical protein